VPRSIRSTRCGTSRKPYYLRRSNTCRLDAEIGAELGLNLDYLRSRYPVAPEEVRCEGPERFRLGRDRGGRRARRGRHQVLDAGGGAGRCRHRALQSSGLLRQIVQGLAELPEPSVLLLRALAAGGSAELLHALGLPRTKPLHLTVEPLHRPHQRVVLLSSEDEELERRGHRLRSGPGDHARLCAARGDGGDADGRLEQLDAERIHRAEHGFDHGVGLERLPRRCIREELDGARHRPHRELERPAVTLQPQLHGLTCTQVELPGGIQELLGARELTDRDQAIPWPDAGGLRRAAAADLGDDDPRPTAARAALVGDADPAWLRALCVRGGCERREHQRERGRGDDPAHGQNQLSWPAETIRSAASRSAMADARKPLRNGSPGA
jgi:hypothetical protein